MRLNRKKCPVGPKIVTLVCRSWRVLAYSSHRDFGYTSVGFGRAPITLLIGLARGLSSYLGRGRGKNQSMVIEAGLNTARCPDREIYTRVHLFAFAFIDDTRNDLTVVRMSKMIWGAILRRCPSKIRSPFGNSGRAKEWTRTCASYWCFRRFRQRHYRKRNPP